MESQESPLTSLYLIHVAMSSILCAASTRPLFSLSPRLSYLEKWWGQAEVMMGQGEIMMGQAEIMMGQAEIMMGQGDIICDKGSHSEGPGIKIQAV